MSLQYRNTSFLTILVKKANNIYKAPCVSIKSTTTEEIVSVKTPWAPSELSFH